MLINSDADAASALRRLNNDGYGQIAVPFKGIGFTGGLTDKGLPVYVCGNAWITGAIAHPADHRVWIDRNSIVCLYIAEGNRVSIGEDGYIGFTSGSGKCCGGKTFLRQNTDTDKAYTVFAVLRKCEKIFGFNRDSLTRFQLIDNNMLCIYCIESLRSVRS